MKNKLLVAGIICANLFAQIKAVVVEDQAKEKARKLVEIVFERDISNDFHAGETSSHDRKRLRENLMTDTENPYRYDEVNQRSLAQRLLWKARKVERELARGQN